MAARSAAGQYAKMATHSNTDGEMYEVKMSALLFLRALNCGVVFEMGSNVDDAGALDDIVFRYKPNAGDVEWTALYVQLKHKQTEHLTDDKLNSCNGDFSIYKYFKSFLLIKYLAMNSDKRLFDGVVHNSYCAIVTNADKFSSYGNPQKTAKTYKKALTSMKQNYLDELRAKDKENTKYGNKKYAKVANVAKNGNAISAGNDNKQDALKTAPVVSNDPDCIRESAPDAATFRRLLGSAQGNVLEFGVVEKDQRTPMKTDKRNKAGNKAKDQKGTENPNEKALDIMKQLSQEKLAAEMEAFLCRLLIFHSQPSVKELDREIRNELKKRLQLDRRYGGNFDSVFTNFMLKIETLCAGTDVLDNESAVVFEAWNKAVADDCSSCEEVFNRLYNIQFRDGSLTHYAFSRTNMNEATEVLYLLQSSESSTRLSLTKLLQALEDGYLLYGIKALSDSAFQSSIVAAWQSGTRKTLVVAWNESEMVVNEENWAVIRELYNATTAVSGKRIIVLTNGDDAPDWSQKYASKVIEDEFDFATLAEETQNMIYGSQFCLQNHVTQVDTLFSGRRDLAAKHMTASALVEIVDGARGRHSNAPQPKDRYIDRWLERVELVEPSILSDTSLTESVLVRDATMYAVQSLVARADSSLSPLDIESTLHNISQRHQTSKTLGKFECAFGANESSECLLLRSRSDTHLDSKWFIFVLEGFDLDKLPALIESHKIRHTLRVVGCELQWVETLPGTTMRIIQGHLAGDRVTSLAPDTVADIDDRLVVICAEPGMGKTTLIGHLVRQTKILYPGWWVVAVPLNYHTHLLKGKEHGNAFDFLAAAAGIRSEFQKAVLQLALEETGTVAVVLDGFDEISDSYSEQCRTLLSALLRTKTGKVWVTSRFANKDLLENHMGTLSRRLRPFNDEDKKTFFRSFLKAEEIDEETIDRFVPYVLDEKNTAFSEHEQRLMGIPLQTRMVAEVSVDLLRLAKDAAEEDKDAKWEKMKDTLKKMDLLFLIQAFVAKKRDIYVHDKLKIAPSDAHGSLLIASDREEYNKLHTHFALHAIFSDEDLGEFQMVSSSKAEKKLLAKLQSGEDRTGIIDGIINGKPNFIHRVFPEYFVAKWIADNVGENITLLKKTLHTANFCVVREILDKILARGCPLHTAVLNEDVDEVQRLLTQGVDVNAEDKGGRTAMHLAAAIGTSEDNERNKKRIQILDCLTKNKSAAYGEDKLLKYAPLQYADCTRTWAAADRLLTEDTPIPIETLPEIFKGLEVRDYNMVRNIVDNDLVNLLRSCLNHEFGRQAFSGKLREAVDSKRLKVATLLAGSLSSSEASNEDTREAFRIALEDKCTDVAIALIGCGVDIESPLGLSNYRPLMVASRSGQEAVVRALLAKIGELGSESRTHFFVNCDGSEGYPAIFLAAEYGNVLVVKCLFEAGSKINLYHGYTALLRAGANGHVDVIEFLLGAIRDPARRMIYLHRRSRDGLTALSLAVRAGNSVLARMLMGHGADLNRGCFGGTVLHVAVDGKSEEAVKAVLELVPESERTHFFSQTDNYGKTAMHLARSLESLEIVRLLVKAGASLTQKDGEGRTVLMFAAGEGSVEQVEGLLSIASDENTDGSSAGIDFLSSVDKNGWTAFHHAAGQGRHKVVASLTESLRTFRSTPEEIAEVVNLANKDGNTALHLAAMHNNVELMSNLFAAGAVLNEENEAKQTPLIIGAIHGHLEVVRLLVRKLPESVKKCDEGGMTPLHHASFQGHKEVVQLLIAMKASAELRDKLGRTPLHLAAKHEDPALVTALVEATAKTGKTIVDYVEMADNANHTAIDIAVIEGNLRTLKYLINKAGQFQLKDTNAPHNISLRSSHIQLFAFLIEQRINVLDENIENRGKLLISAVRVGEEPDVGMILDAVGRDALAAAADDQGNTALLLAAASGDAALYETLVRAGAEQHAVNAHKETALMLAAARGDLATVDKTYSGADIDLKDSDGRTALHHAANGGNDEVVEYLMQKGAKVLCLDAENRTPLHYAAPKAYLSVVDTLIRAGGANVVNAVEGKGNSAIHLAAGSGAPGALEVIRLLSREGGDLKSGNAAGQTPLMLAAESGKHEVVEWLVLETPQDDIQSLWRSQDQAGKTALHYACQSRTVGIFEMIMHAGANLELSPSNIVHSLRIAKMTLNDLEIRDQCGNTALHLAATNGDRRIVRHLLAAGADVTLVNDNGETALICAAISGNYEVVRQLVFHLREDDMRSLCGIRPRSDFIHVKDKALKSALDHAEDHADIAEFLNEEAGIWKGVVPLTQ